MSDGRVVSRTMAKLVFKEEDFATCSAKQSMSVEGFTRRCKGGKSIVVGIVSVNMDNMLEEDGNIGSSKSKAGEDGEPLVRCNVDFGPNKEMGSMVRLGMVNMLNCKEQIVECLEENHVTELLGQGIRKHQPTKELRSEFVCVQEVQDATQFRKSKLESMGIEVINIHAVNDSTFSKDKA